MEDTGDRDKQSHQLDISELHYDNNHKLSLHLFFVNLRKSL